MRSSLAPSLVLLVVRSKTDAFVPHQSSLHHASWRERATTVSRAAAAPAWWQQGNSGASRVRIQAEAAADSAAAAGGSDDSEEVASAALVGEELMDAKLKGLGVSWYQALMCMFVAMVYAADGAEVTVMSLVSKEIAAKFSLATWEKGLLGMSVYTGMFTGGLVSGPIADTKGRSLTLLSATLLISIFGIASAYCPTFMLLCGACVWVYGWVRVEGGDIEIEND